MTWLRHQTVPCNSVAANSQSATLFTGLSLSSINALVWHTDAVCCDAFFSVLFCLTNSSCFSSCRFFWHIATLMYTRTFAFFTVTRFCPQLAWLTCLYLLFTFFSWWMRRSRPSHPRRVQHRKRPHPTAALLQQMQVIANLRLLRSLSD